MTTKKFITAVVICLAVIGFLVLCIGLVFLALNVLQSYGICWEIGLISVGVLLLILALFGSRLFSDVYD